MQQHFLQGDTSLVALLYQQHAASIFRQVRRHIFSLEDAEDITLDIFLAAIEQEETLNEMNDDARLNWLRRAPWNQIHRTDSSLLNHYQLKTGVVVVVSLLEQCMRVYQNGQLIKAFQVRAGSDEVSSLPGSWQVIQRQEDVTVMSSFPKGSAFWYPPTPIQYLLTYHTGGYTILGSWWSTSYGRGTNFPHDNASGNAERNNGLSAGVWLSSENMAWLYNHVQMNTSVVIY